MSPTLSAMARCAVGPWLLAATAACTTPTPSSTAQPGAGAPATAVTSPDTPREARLAIGDQALAYLKAGRGPAVVVIHGIGGHKEDWKGTMAALAGRHTVYAIDMLGYGKSSRGGPELTLRTQADAVRALLDAERIDRASLVGNSVGGWVAATFASAWPERTSRLVLVDAAGLKAMFAGPPPVNFAPTSVDEMQKLLQYSLASDWAHTRAFAEKAFAGFQASGEAQTLPKFFAGFQKSALLDDLLPKIQAPTLVVWGDSDRLFPLSMADTVTTGIAGARKVVIPRAGHFPHVDNAQAFEAAVAGFLAP